MKLFKILLLSLAIFFTHVGYTLDFVDKEHKTRCAKFDLNRSDPTLAAHTKCIGNILVDPNHINYSRTLTEPEKKRAYKAMMGSVMVHNASLSSLYGVKGFANPLNESKYKRHVAAVNVVDEAIRILWGKFTRRESHTLEDVLSSMSSRPNPQKFNYQKLLTGNFVNLFYETLEQHLPEQNFFAGKATLEWFDSTTRLYANNDAIPSVLKYTKNKFEMIIDADLKPVAIYKQLINQSGEPNARNRQVKVEYVSWLVAKMAGLTDIVNPVIPVRKTKAGFVVDPFNYDGSLEPVAATVLKDERGALDTYGRLKNLLSGALNFANCTTFKRGYLREPIGIFCPNLFTYSAYFSNRFPESHGHFSFLDCCRGSENKNKIADLTSFRNAVSLKHLWDVVVFWYLTLQEDMNPSNILYIPNQFGKIVPQVIDYDIALGKDTDIGKRIPLVYAFPQANQSLQTDFFDTLVHLTERRLTRIIDTYKKAVRGDEASELEADTAEKLIGRFRILQQIPSSAAPQTLKEIMLKLIEMRKYSALEIELSRIYRVVGATILDPLKFGDFTFNRPTKHAKILGNLTKHRTRTISVYALPWIFEVNEEEQLDGFFDKDYVPLEEMHGAWKRLFDAFE